MIALGCTDETISGYADPDAVYRLVEIDGQAFTPRATIAFKTEGRAEGSAPCNTWSAEQSVPYPWFELGAIAATKRACPELDAEQQYFDALAQMTLAEVQGPILILTNDDAREMIFQAN